ncbi:hypothetical protein [Novosphingobium sp. LASN5T]|uniref:hypothetical protein n=1 Tax=Novosphingobium sp. LASN5T TaxID=2491021 RepID=UPI000F5FAC0B|nr:hypothetical protein [Novosphingobium sp. LASN5T]RQW43519.1 hypothetical protein EH199_13060 [Novosphingobium sp. LASN5T]
MKRTGFAAGLILAAAAATAIGGSMGMAASTPNTRTTSTDGHRRDVPAATPTGPAVSCIPLVGIRESQVRDDWTIDFRTAGNKWYRNTLPYRCSSLGFERAFSYATSLSQLCNTDIITVIATGGGGGPRGSCGLGSFQPVDLAKKLKK